MKKTICNIQFTLLGLLLTVIVSSCKEKEDTYNPQPLLYYTSMSDFYAANGVQTETFTINAATGGSFESAKGSKVFIPANVFLNPDSSQTTGMVKIEFRDIYEKSDMVLSNMPTALATGELLKSGGEFFIRALRANDAVPLLINGKSPIKVELATNGQAADSAMEGFIWTNGAGGSGWQRAQGEAYVNFSAENFVAWLYKFDTPVIKGTWYNCDNASYFSNYTQTVLTINPTVNGADYQMDAFLVFKGVNTSILLGRGNQGKFYYNYAPVGLQCTVVAMGLKAGRLYSSFTDITISPNQTVSVGLAETTEGNFKAKLKTLNN